MPTATASPSPTSTPAPTSTPTPTPTPTPAALPQPAQSPAITAASLQAPVGDPLETPPDLNKVVFSEVDADGMLTVTGQAGAVPGTYTVFIQSLQTGAAIKTTSASDGSFQTNILATEGSTIVIGYGDAQARDLMGGGPAVQVTVNLPRPSSPTEILFTIAGPDGVGTGHWVGQGAQNGWSCGPGDTVRYTIDFAYTSPNITGNVDLEQIGVRRLYPQLNLSRISDAEGDPVQATFVPVLLTPTGLPIFSRDGYEYNADPFEATVKSVERTGDTLTMSIEFSQRIPEWLPSGYYVGRIRWNPRFIWEGTQPANLPSGNEEDLLLRGGAAVQTLLPAMRIGTPAPPRLPWVLLANTLSNGTRGTVAREDKGTFDLGNKVTFNADKFITQKDRSYRLEPFLPTLGFHMGGPNRVAPPLVSFLFPSGELHVTVTRPDGTVDDLGRAPFRSARTDPGIVFGPTSVQALYELTTLDPSFQYEFSAYGHYVVQMEGWTQDATGITYSGGGSYDVYVAETLDLDLGTFLNTPFEVGDTMSPVVHTRPGVPADVTVDFKLFPNSSTRDVISKTIGDSVGMPSPSVGPPAKTLTPTPTPVVPTANPTPTSGTVRPSPVATQTPTTTTPTPIPHIRGAP